MWDWGFARWRWCRVKSGLGFIAVITLLALSQRLSPLGLIFRSPTLTSGKIILINFRIF